MFQSIKSDILEFLFLYYRQAFIFAIIMLFSTGIIYQIYLHRKKQYVSITKVNISKTICLLLLFFYSYLVIGITVLSRDCEDVPTIRLELFSTFQNNYHSRLYMYENLLLFVPLAVLIYILFERIRKGYIFFIIGFIVSLLIEVVQYITRRGFCEVDDLLTNVVGMMVGYMIMCLGHQGIKLLKSESDNHAKQDI